MKKILVFGLVIAVTLFMATGMVTADSYVVDGNLTPDWGVVPFVNWVPSSETATYVVEDYDGTNPSEKPLGNEAFDIEYACSDNNGTHLFIGGVTSFRYTGDTGIDLNNDGICEYGIVTRPLQPNYGVVYKDPIWSEPLNPGEAPGQVIGGTIVGMATMAQVQIGPDPGWKPNIPNYVIEIMVERSVLGNPTAGQLSEILITMWCGNDEIVLGVKWTEEIPEFSTIAIPAIAVLGLFLFFNKRKQKRQNN